jgi:hypothetical protein
MADRVNIAAGSGDKVQLELDFQLPADAAKRRRRICAIRHHFLCLLEDVPVQAGFSARRWRAVQSTLKRLLKSDLTSWDGTGTFRTKEVARDWMVGERTLRRHLEAARVAGLVATTVSTDSQGCPRTTLEYRWWAIAALLGRPAIPPDPADQPATGPGDQPARCADQPARYSDQPATRADQPAMVAGTYYRFPEAPASSSVSAGEPVDPWPAAAAAVLAVCPSLSLACLAGARAAGCTAREVVAIAEHWRSEPGVWGAGALFRRIQRALPGLAAEAAWPQRRRTGAVPDRSRQDEEDAIRYRVLRRAKKPAGMSDDEWAEERERLVARAMATVWQQGTVR